MSIQRLGAFVACVVGVVGMAGSADAAQPGFTSKLVAQGLGSVLYVTHAPGDFERVFIVRQGDFDSATIHILDISQDPPVLVPEPFITIDGLSTGGEQGLLGLAFHPQYAANGQFYVNYTDESGDTHIAGFLRDPADPNRALAGSQFPVLFQDQPYPNHNGGWLAFGPDGFLYVALGDGGAGGDPDNNAQNPQSLLGKILRLDVDGDDFPADPLANYAIPPSNPFAGSMAGRPEIWAMGLRNPWRCAFDRLTGDLWIADVGQGVFEEIDVQPASDPSALPGTPGYQGGRNYGWRCLEGLMCTPYDGCLCPFIVPNLAPPYFAYDHDLGCSITGGYVYRGCAIPELQGEYFFGDYCTPKIWTVQGGLPSPVAIDRTAALDPGGGLDIKNIVSFGEDAYGEIYVCDYWEGEVFKIVPTVNAPDCNENGRIDACDILDGSSLDANGNGVPDECEPPCAADCDESGNLDIDDFICFQTLFALNDLTADCDQSGTLNIDDFICFQTLFALGC